MLGKASYARHDASLLRRASPFDSRKNEDQGNAQQEKQIDGALRRFVVEISERPPRPHLRLPPHRPRLGSRRALEIRPSQREQRAGDDAQDRDDDLKVPQQQLELVVRHSVHFLWLLMVQVRPLPPSPHHRGGSALPIADDLSLPGHGH